MKELLYLLALLFVLFAVLKLFYVVGTVSVLGKTKGALFVPTSRKKIKVLLKELPLARDMRVVDLGCGDGRFLRALWRYHRIAGEGFDINWFAVLEARFLNLITRTPVKIYRRDFFEVPLNDYDLVFLYLFPDLLLDLKPKLEKELRPGTWVVSCNFPLPGWSPEQVLKVDNPIFIYRKT